MEEQGPWMRTLKAQSVVAMEGAMLLEVLPKAA
jgi:hypothetical protein